MAKNTTKPLPVDVVRSEIYEAMSAPLQRVADFIQQQQQRQNMGVIKIGYQIGQKIHNVMSDQDSYGQDAEAVKQLASYTGVSRDTLYAYRGVVNAYPDWKEFEAIVSEPLKDGNTMTLTHMVAVSRIAKDADRKKLLKRIKNESMTANEAHMEATSQFEARNKRSGGRKPSKPTSAQACYQQIRNEAQRMNNRFDLTWMEIFDEVDSVSPDKLDPELKKKAEESLSEIDKLEQFIMQARPRLEKNIQRIEKVVAEREQKNKG